MIIKCEDKKATQSLGRVHLKSCLNVRDWIWVVATAVMWQSCVRVMRVIPTFPTYKNLSGTLN